MSGFKFYSMQNPTAKPKKAWGTEERIFNRCVCIRRIHENAMLQITSTMQGYEKAVITWF